MEKLFTKAANSVAYAAGKPVTFIGCCAVILIWAVSGPVFGFSDTWQLIINTGTTIVTFLMVFLIQNTQNRDGAAIQAKLDELIRVSEGQNKFIGIEHLTEEEVEQYRRLCEKAAKAADAAATDAENTDAKAEGPASTSQVNKAKPRATNGKARTSSKRKGTRSGTPRESAAH